MAILLLREAFRPVSAPRGTLASGDVVEYNGTIINAGTDKPLGVVIDGVPSDSPPSLLDVHGDGAIIQDDALTSATVGALVYSDGDGTYSTTEPGVAAGIQFWVLGVIRRSDSASSDIEIAIHTMKKEV